MTDESSGQGNISHPMNRPPPLRAGACEKVEHQPSARRYLRTASVRKMAMIRIE